MRHLVDHDRSWVARECGIEVEFVELLSAVENLATREDRETLQQLCSLGAAVRFDEPDDNVDAGRGKAARPVEHRECLADTGCSAEKDGQLAFARGRRSSEQGVWIRTAVDCVPGHQLEGLAANRSRARLSFRTFTRLSPMKPSCGPSVWAVTSASTWSAGSLRARATRATWS